MIDTTETAIKLIEVMELPSKDNPHIENLQRQCFQELKMLLEGTTANWLLALILEARRRAREAEA